MPARVSRRKTATSGKKVYTRSKSNYKPYAKYNLPKLNQEKANVFLFDNDEFYGMTLDLVLFNFNFESALKLGSSKILGDLNSIVENMKSGDIKDSVVIINENYLAEHPRLIEIVDKIKVIDKKAKVIFTTTVVDFPEDLVKQYDYVVVKSGRSNDNTLIKTLSEVLGVEFIADNSDPEIE